MDFAAQNVHYFGAMKQIGKAMRQNRTTSHLGLRFRFLFRFTAAALLAMAVTGQALPANADETAGMTRICRMLYKEWRKVATHKAFAASQVIDNMQACGYSYAWENQKKAVSSAIGHCKSSAAYRNLKGATCRLVKAL